MARDTEQQRLTQIRMQQQQVQQPSMLPVPQAQPPAMMPLQQQYMQMMSQMQAQMQSQRPQFQQPMPSSQIMPYGYGGVSHMPVPSYMPVNYYMPPYLSVPEPMNGSYTGMLGRTILRSMVKSVGHSLAAVLDTTPFAPTMIPPLPPPEKK